MFSTPKRATSPHGILGVRLILTMIRFYWNHFLDCQICPNDIPFLNKAVDHFRGKKKHTIFRINSTRTSRILKFISSEA